MIHSTHLNPIDKFQRLNSLLSGNARRFIDSVKITANNYDLVWADLNKYYDNPRRITASHVKGILDIRSTQSERADEVRRVLSNFQGHMRALTATNLQTNAEIFQIELLLSKLDECTRKKWEAKMTAVSSIPKLIDLYDLVEKRIRVLEVNPIEHHHLNTRVSRLRIVSNVATNSDSPSCYICEQPHRVYSCYKLLNAPLDQKLPMVEGVNLCKNCLRPGHFAKDCLSVNCYVKGCIFKHHTLLHEACLKYEPESTSTSI